MSDPAVIEVTNIGPTYRAKRAGKGGYKLSCTCTMGPDQAAQAWVRKYAGKDFEAVKTNGTVATIKGTTYIYEFRRIWRPS